MEERNAGMAFGKMKGRAGEREAHMQGKEKGKGGAFHAAMDADTLARQAAALARDWGYARENIYPILMAAGDGKFLEGLAFLPVLDLAVTYAVRLSLPGGREGIVRVKDFLPGAYGISREEMHGQAMRNMGKDGYHFERMEETLFGIPGFSRGDGPVRMYVLSNQTGAYGAAGLLDTGLIARFAGGCDYYILPSSVHELIFIPASDVEDAGELDRLVEEITLTAVPEKERLSCHSYFYDAALQEVRICR